MGIFPNALLLRASPASLRFGLPAAFGRSPRAARTASVALQQVQRRHTPTLFELRRAPTAEPALRGFCG